MWCVYNVFGAVYVQHHTRFPGSEIQERFKHSRHSWREMEKILVQWSDSRSKGTTTSLVKKSAIKQGTIVLSLGGRERSATTLKLSALAALRHQQHLQLFRKKKSHLHLNWQLQRRRPSLSLTTTVLCKVPWHSKLLDSC